MKKTFLLTSAVSLLAVSLMASCQSSSVSAKPISEENFAYQALTTVNMLGAKSAIQSKARISFKNSDAEEDDDDSDDETVNLEECKATIESYLNQADLYLSNQATPFVFSNLASDKDEYLYKQGFTFTDLANKTVEYVIYYNIAVSEDWTYTEDDVQNDSSEDIVPTGATSTKAFKRIKNEKDKDNDDDDEEEDEKEEDDDDDDELSFKDGQMMEGIALFEEKTYKFQTKRTSFNDGSATSESVGMRMTLEEGKYSSSVTTYYKIKTDANKTSEEFSYEIRENGEEVMEFEISKPSSKNGKIEMEVNDLEYDIRKEDKFNGIDGDYLVVSFDDDENNIFLVYERIVNADATITYKEVK